MFNFRPILYVLGIVLVTLAVTMLIPMMADYSHDDINWVSFALGFLITLFFGVLLILMNYQKNFELSVRQIFLLTVTCWIGVSFFASIPFILSSAFHSFTDSIFEVVSGVTTTGVSVLSNLENLPRGVVLWRALLQGLGGMGFVVADMLFLPFMRVGGMQLYQTEASENDKFLPRTVQIAGNIAGTYCLLIFLCTLAYGLVGMDLFDAFCHAMPTIATGGFSTHDASIGYYNSLPIELVSMVFMILGALPFILILRAFSGSTSALVNDAQVRGYLKSIVFSVIAVTLYVYFTSGRELFSVLREVAFNVVSVATTTGFVSANYNLWGTFGVLVLFYYMFVGGCSGSTAAGIKVFRIQMLKKMVSINIQKMVYPHASLRLVYNRKTVSDDVRDSVKTFFFVYVVVFACLTLAMGLTGVTLETAISSIAQGMANVGVAFGEQVGPHTNFANIPDSSKWVLVVTMLMGRLELLNFMVLFTPFFWKR